MNLRVARYIDRWVGLGVCFVLWAAARLLSAGRMVPALFATTPAHADAARPRRVLAIKFYGLGNIAMILPTLAAMKADDPDIEIDFLTLPGNVTLLEQSGLVTRPLTVEVSGFGDFLGSVLGLYDALRGGDYDAVLDFEQFMKLSGIFAFATGASSRVGFNTDGQARGWLYTHRVAYADTDHMADIFMRLALPFGRAVHPAPHVKIAIDPGDRERALAAAGVAEGEGLVAMHVGTGPNYGKVALKRWDVERFARLADRLVETLGVRIVFTGVGEEEGELIRVALAHMEQRDRARSLCDVLTVGELTGLLQACAFVVSNDTSVMHLTNLVETPVVAIFGATEPRLYGPRGSSDLVFYRGLFCSPCLSNYNLKMSRCVDPVCMKQIGVDEVAAGIDARFSTAARAV